MHWQFNLHVSECLFSNLLSECFSSGVPGWLGLREPDT